MQKAALSLIALTAIACFPEANASPIAKVTALESQAWVQQGTDKKELNGNSNLHIGDHIITGDSGRVEIQVWSYASMRLNKNSEIRFLAREKTESTTAEDQPILNVHKGTVCIDYKPQSKTENYFELSIGNTIVTTTFQNCHICLMRADDLSSIVLRRGSVQITHSIDPSIIVLSESGTEYRIDDDGSYELLHPGMGDSEISEIDKPFIIEPEIENEKSMDTTSRVEGDVVAADEVAIKESKPATSKKEANYIYTVYLFSTRSKDVANQANNKFQKAGHDTKIIVSQKDSTTRYRIAVSGFESLQLAKEFSSSMVGRLGISDTWIGKERRKN